MPRSSPLPELDDALVAAAGEIRVLDALAWPAETEELFLRGWRKGAPELPAPGLQPRDDAAAIETLDAIVARCDEEDPAQRFTADTARSYANAARMLAAIGTPDFTRWSIVLYRRPDEVYRTQGISPLDAARFFLEVTDELLGGCHIPATEPTIPAEEFADWMKGEVEGFFREDAVEIVLDPTIVSKALAGANRVRVRSTARFSDLDYDQLLQHEAFVHAATMLNGRKQPVLRGLGMGAPRTTRTQEGLAVLSEIVTDAIDIARLRRIAQRVLAVKQALDGADFIEVFESFLDAGQSEVESFRSAQRIFRGGDVRGGVPFTKDAVYLAGVLEVHTFLRIAIRDNRPELIANLFAGRMTLGDAVRLAPLFESGALRPPVYVPPWAADLRRLAAAFAFSAFLTRIRLDRIDLDSFVRYEEATQEG